MEEVCTGKTVGVGRGESEPDGGKGRERKTAKIP